MTEKWMTLSPKETTISWWIERYLPEFVLWLWDDAPIPHAEHAVEIVPRAEVRSHPVSGDIQYVNAFTLWRMAASSRCLILDDGRWRAALSPDELTHVRRLQVELGRGLISPVEHAPMAAGDAVDGKLVLDHHLWAELTAPERRDIVLRQLIDWDDPDVLHIPEDVPEHITAIANTFVHQDGVNCLGTTSYAITAERRLLESWLWQDEFREVLAAHSYAPVALTSLEQGDAVTFVGDGDIQHAAYALGNDRFLNKSGQSSYNPVRVIDWQTLRAEWPELEIQIWRRRSS